MNMVLFNIHNYIFNPSLILNYMECNGSPIHLIRKYHGSLKMGEAGGSRKRSEDWTGV